MKMRIASSTAIIYMMLQIFHICDSKCTAYYVILEEISIGPNVLLQTISKKSLNWKKITFPANSTDTEECILDMECLGLETTCTERPTTVKNYGVHKFIPDEVTLFNKSNGNNVETFREIPTTEEYIATTEYEFTSTIIAEESSTDLDIKDTTPDDLTTLESTTNDYSDTTISDFVTTATSTPIYESTTDVTLSEDVIQVEREKLKHKNEQYKLGNNEKQTKDDSEGSLIIILATIAAVLGGTMLIFFGVRQLITYLQSGSYRFPDSPPKNDEEEIITDMMTSV